MTKFGRRIGLPCGSLMGPPKETMPIRWLYAGFGVSWPVNENALASSAEFPSRKPTLPLYKDRAPRRLLPKAADWAKGDAAPLLTLPLMRNPSEGAWLASAAPEAAAGAGSAGAFAASPDAF